MFKNLSVSRRLTLGFAAVIASFLLAAAASLFSGARLAEADRWNVHTYKVLAAGDRMLKAMINMETGARGFLLSGVPDFLAPWNAGLSEFDAAWSEARSLTADNPGQQQRLAAMKARHGEFKEISEASMALRREVAAGKRTLSDLETDFRRARGKAAMDGFRAVNNEFDKAERDLLSVRSTQAESLRALSRNAVVFGSLAGLVLAGFIGYRITRSITGPIDRAVQVARTVASGDLTSHIEVTSGDELGQLLLALRSMNESLVEVVGTVRTSSDSIATGSSQIATGNADLSQRTEEQASNLQQTAATMEQLTNAVRQSADVAQQANVLAGSASDAASRGGEVVAQVVSTMHEITESSRRIGEIIGVIDGIAFQTNILALNAAVEAARAGEQGRGFAVVAGEVRSLAQRSADAAKEIKSLIGASVERVENGSRLVSAAGESMNDIVSQVRRVSDLIAEISAAATQQNGGIGQVNDAVTQLDQVTQQNAALVEESTAAAESLSHQAANLVKAVAVFKLAR